MFKISLMAHKSSSFKTKRKNGQKLNYIIIHFFNCNGCTNGELFHGLSSAIKANKKFTMQF